MQVNLRLRRRLHARLEHSAAKRNSSLNGEMVVRLESSFEHEDLKPVLAAIIDQQKLSSRILGGWLASELRGRGLADDVADEFAELVRDYFGRPDGAA